MLVIKRVPKKDEAPKHILNLLKNFDTVEKAKVFECEVPLTPAQKTKGEGIAFQSGDVAMHRFKEAEDSKPSGKKDESEDLYTGATMKEEKVGYPRENRVEPKPGPMGKGKGNAKDDVTDIAPMWCGRPPAGGGIGMDDENLPAKDTAELQRPTSKWRKRTDMPKIH